MDKNAIVLAGMTSIDAAYKVRNISSLLYNRAFIHFVSTLRANSFNFQIRTNLPKILKYFERFTKAGAEEFYQRFGRKKIEELKRKEAQNREEAIRNVDEETKMEGKKEIEEEIEAKTAANKETIWFYDALFEVVEKATKDVAKELKKEDPVCNAEECTDVLRYQAAMAIAEIIVEEMTDVITRVSVEGTELMYKAKLGTYDPQNVTYVNVAFKELGVFPILKHFQHDVESIFVAFSLAFYETKDTIRDGKQMRSPFEDISAEMIQKLSGLNAWLENPENDCVQVDKFVSDTFCMIMEYIMQPFIAGMGTLGRLSTTLKERWTQQPNFQCTVTQFTSIKRNLLKIMSTFESLEKLVYNMEGLENTLPSPVDVEEWKARIEHITYDMKS